MCRRTVVLTFENVCLLQRSQRPTSFVYSLSKETYCFPKETYLVCTVTRDLLTVHCQKSLIFMAKETYSLSKETYFACTNLLQRSNASVN